VCVVLVTQHAKGMRHYILNCSLSGSTIFFHISSHTVQFYEQNVLNIKRLFWFFPQLLSETFFILRRIHPDIITSVQQKSSDLKVTLSPETEVTPRTAAIIIRVVHSFPIFVHSCRFPAFHSLQSFTPRIY